MLYLGVSCPGFVESQPAISLLTQWLPLVVSCGQPTSCGRHPRIDLSAHFTLGTTTRAMLHVACPVCHGWSPVRIGTFAIAPIVYILCVSIKLLISISSNTAGLSAVCVRVCIVRYVLRMYLERVWHQKLTSIGDIIAA